MEVGGGLMEPRRRSRKSGPRVRSGAREAEAIWGLDSIGVRCHRQA